MTGAVEVVTSNMVASRRALHRIGILGLALTLPLLLAVMLTISAAHARI